MSKLAGIAGTMGGVLAVGLLLAERVPKVTVYTSAPLGKDGQVDPRTINSGVDISLTTFAAEKAVRAHVENALFQHDDGMVLTVRRYASFFNFAHDLPTKRCFIFPPQQRGAVALDSPSGFMSRLASFEVK